MCLPFLLTRVRHQTYDGLPTKLVAAASGHRIQTRRQDLRAMNMTIRRPILNPRSTLAFFFCGLSAVPLPAQAQGPGGERQTTVSGPHQSSPADSLPPSQAAGQPAEDEIVEEPDGKVSPAAPQPRPSRAELRPIYGGSAIIDRLESLEQRNAELTQRLKDLERRLQIVTSPSSSVRLTGYIDAGFFAFLRGNGAGITNYIASPQITGGDARARYLSFKNSPQVSRFPEFFAPCGFDDDSARVTPCPQAPQSGLAQTQARWRFLGDPLATAINSQGHPADVRAQNNPGQSSLAVPYDYIQSAGRPSFIINEVNLTPIAKLGENLQAFASISFYPRSASISIGDKADGGSVQPGGPTHLGDYLGINLAFLEWSPTFGNGRHQISIFAGRFDPNIGIEYRVRFSPDRFGVTPSLICRYSCGTPIGLKLRGKFFDEWLQIALAVHNGPSYQEIFRFSEQTDKKYMKTLSGRIALHAPWAGGVELGLSGEYGGQVDGFYDAPGRSEFDPFVPQWTVDVDLHAEWRGLELRFEYLKTVASGFDGLIRDPSTGKVTAISAKPALPMLEAQGAYIELSYRLLNWLGLMARFDVRDARHVDYTVPFAYVSQLWRITAAARFDINSNIALKAEYLHLQPYGRMSEGLADNAATPGALPGVGDFAADYLTSSLVLRY
jgi:hypothetical protein